MTSLAFPWGIMLRVFFHGLKIKHENIGLGLLIWKDHSEFEYNIVIIHIFKKRFRVWKSERERYICMYIYIYLKRIERQTDIERKGK